MSSEQPAAAGCCSSSPPRRGPAKPPSSSGSSRLSRIWALSRSYTSRATRAGESDGVDYNFITRERFEAMVAGRTPSWSGRTSSATSTGPARPTPSGSWPRAAIWCSSSTSRARGRCAPGAHTIGIFVLPPSFEALERRLRGRSKDSEEAIRRRLATAREEVAAVAEYDYVVVNDELDACVDRLRAIVLAERARLAGDGGGR